MTRDETQVLLAGIMAVYPNWHPENKTEVVNAWHSVMEDYPKDAVGAAFKEYVRSDRAGFAPSPGQLIGLIIDRNAPRSIPDMEAWQMVYRAICNSNYHADEEFDKLPSEIQKALGSPSSLREMAMMEADAMSVEQSHFLRSYHTILERKRQDQTITPFERLGEVERPQITHTEKQAIEGHTERATPEVIERLMSMLKGEANA